MTFVGVHGHVDTHLHKYILYIFSRAFIARLCIGIDWGQHHTGGAWLTLKQPNVFFMPPHQQCFWKCVLLVSTDRALHEAAAVLLCRIWYFEHMMLLTGSPALSPHGLSAEDTEHRSHQRRWHKEPSCVLSGRPVWQPAHFLPHTAQANTEIHLLVQPADSSISPLWLMVWWTWKTYCSTSFTIFSANH